MSRLAKFLESASKDKRLLPSHVSLFTAICHLEIDENFEGITVTRRKLMGFACIRAISTYHIIMSQLQAFGYIIYKPTYHPTKGSLVYLI